MSELRTFVDPHGVRWVNDAYLEDRNTFATLLGAVIGAAVVVFIGAWLTADIRDALQATRAYQMTEFSRAPPVEFVGGTEVRVRFTTSDQIKAICGERAAACWDGANERVVMPHPCWAIEWIDGQEPYRETMCHELAHVGGWRHERPQ